MASPARGFRKQVPTDVWAVRERLALACSVLRSGDQNWVSVSRAIRPFSEPNRPSDWFSQKNCALQYSELLEKVDAPKRKRADRGESDTAGDLIVRKLSNERTDELKKAILDRQLKYKKLKREIEAIKAGQFDEKLPQIWQEMQQQKKAAQEAAQAARQKAVEESAARAAAAAVRAQNKPITLQNKLKRPQPGLKLKTTADTEENTNTTETVTEVDVVKVEEKAAPSTQTLAAPAQLEVKPKPTPPSSPLLSSLLQSKHELQKALSAQQPTATQQQQQQPPPPPQQQQQQQQVVRPSAPSTGGGEVSQPNPTTSQPVTAPTVTSQVKAEITVPIPTIEIKEEPAETVVSPERTVKKDTPEVKKIISTPTPPAVTTTVVTVRTVPTPAPVSTPVTTGSTTVTPTPPTPTPNVVVKTEVPSSPSIGAPTLSRLLVSPAPTGSTPLKLSTNLAASSITPSQKPVVPATPPSAKTTPTSFRLAASKSKAAAAEPRVETPVFKTTNSETTSSVPSTPTTPTKDLPKPQETVQIQESSSSSEAGKLLAQIAPEEDPASPASSIVSNETDSGSAKGLRTYGRKSRGRGKGNRRISQRLTRGRIQEDDKPFSTGKPSEAESSDDETTQAESDDGTITMTPKMSHSMSESIPNSPASLSQCDTEDEKGYKLWKKSIMLVWRAAANHKYANVFLHPVTNEIAPGYTSVVNRPMDLSAIKKNIESGANRTTAEFQRDMMLMFTNAIMYNNSDHDVYKMAVEMYNDVMIHIEQYVNTQMMVQSEGTKILRQSRRSEASMSDKEDDPKKRKPQMEMDHSHGGKSKKRK